MSGSEISGTSPDRETGGGMGILAQPADGVSSSLTLADVTIGTHPLAGIYLVEPGTCDIRDSNLAGGTGVPASSGSATLLQGNALFARGGAAPRLDHVTVHDATTGILLNGVGVDLSAPSWHDDITDVVMQACLSDAVAPDVGDGTLEFCPRYDERLLPTQVWDLDLTEPDVGDPGFGEPEPALPDTGA
jgi:hypothetical protein